MGISGGAIAGIIAATAFLILVLFIGFFLVRMTKLFTQVNQTMKVMTDDVDTISRQAETIMANSNELLEDINKKVATIDPVFKAAADLGQSVSDLNDATRNLTDRVSNGSKHAASAGLATRVGKGVFSAYKNHRSKKSMEKGE